MKTYGLQPPKVKKPKVQKVSVTKVQQPKISSMRFGGKRSKSSGNNYYTKIFK